MTDRDIEKSLILRNSAEYPANLRCFLKDKAPESITAIGNTDILKNQMIAIFCSVKCPGSLILKTYDYVSSLRDTGKTTIGGFHSPVENDCLKLLMRGKQAVIICPARSLANMRIPREWKKPIEQGRLLLISPFPETDRRATAKLSMYRNEFVAALADTIFIAYAEKGGKTEAFVRKIIQWGKPVHTHDCEENRNLVHLGAKPVVF